MMATVMKARRALILYASMTKNTEKVAGWFQETLDQYGWDTFSVRMAANTDWACLLYTSTPATPSPKCWSACCPLRPDFSPVSSAVRGDGTE